MSPPRVHLVIKSNHDNVQVILSHESCFTHILLYEMSNGLMSNSFLLASHDIKVFNFAYIIWFASTTKHNFIAQY